MNISERIVSKLKDHLEAHQTQATHVMLPEAEAEELRQFIRDKEIPTLAEHAARAAGVLPTHPAGVKLVRGNEFRAWRAAPPVYEGMLSTVWRCRQAPPEELRALGKPDAVASLAQFIVPAGKLWPGFPIYRAWFVGVISLADFPGVPPAQKDAPEMTHEIMVTATDPNCGYDPDPEMPETWHNFTGKVAQQFNLGEMAPAEADAAAVNIAQKCAQAVTDGILPIVDVGDDGRATWAEVIANTVVHILTGGHGGKPS